MIDKINKHGGLIWITGYSGAGKTTVAEIVSRELKQEGFPVLLLDGDNLKSILGEKYGFDMESRRKLAYVYSRLCKRVCDNGINVVDIDTFSIEETFSIGILYINNLGDKNDESIAYNLTNEIIGDFEYIDTIRASSFNDIIKYKDSELQNTDIARKLEIENILRGSILKGNDSSIALENKMSLTGTINKTSILLGLLLISGGFTFSLFYNATPETVSPILMPLLCLYLWH